MNNTHRQVKFDHVELPQNVFCTDLGQCTGSNVLVSDVDGAVVECVGAPSVSEHFEHVGKWMMWYLRHRHRGSDLLMVHVEQFGSWVAFKRFWFLVVDHRGTVGLGQVCLT